MMLKLKEGFILRKVAGENVVVPSGEDLNLNMMITLNDTGAFLWKQLDAGCTRDDLVKTLLKEYDIDDVTASQAVDGFVAKVSEHGFLD